MGPLQAASRTVLPCRAQKSIGPSGLGHSALPRLARCCSSRGRQTSTLPRPPAPPTPPSSPPQETASTSGRGHDAPSSSPHLPAAGHRFELAAQRGSVAVAARSSAHALRAVRRAVDELTSRVDPRVRGLIGLNAMTSLLAVNWIVLKQTSGVALDPVVFSAWRFTLAAAAFTPFLAQAARQPKLLKAGLEIGMWSAAGYLTQAVALASTQASRASLLSTFTVVAVPIMAGMGGAKIKPLVWVCGFLALVGTCLLEQGDGGGGAAAAVDGLMGISRGDVLSILSAIFFAGQLYRTESYSRDLPPNSQLPLVAVVVATTAAAAIAGVAVTHGHDLEMWATHFSAHFSAAWNLAQHSDMPWWQLLYTSLCSTDLVLVIEMLALKDVSSTEAAMVYSLEPLSGALLAWFILGERWGPMGWAGAAVILLASLVTQFSGAEAEALPAEGEPAGAGQPAGQLLLPPPAVAGPVEQQPQLYDGWPDDDGPHATASASEDGL